MARNYIATDIIRGDFSIATQLHPDIDVPLNGITYNIYL